MYMNSVCVSVGVGVCDDVQVCDGVGSPDKT